jgi:hypothetical protein
MLVAVVIQADTDLPTGTFPGPPLKMSSDLQLHIYKRGPEPNVIPHSNSVLLKTMHEARKLNVNFPCA